MWKYALLWRTGCLPFLQVQNHASPSALSSVLHVLNEKETVMLLYRYVLQRRKTTQTFIAAPAWGLNPLKAFGWLTRQPQF
jgi:hypothetical protein